MNNWVANVLFFCAVAIPLPLGLTIGIGLFYNRPSLVVVGVLGVFLWFPTFITWARRKYEPRNKG